MAFFYLRAVDVWSVGCILGELIAGKPLFPGTNVYKQIELIIAIQGTPTDSCLNDIKSTSVRLLWRAVGVVLYVLHCPCRKIIIAFLFVRKLQMKKFVEGLPVHNKIPFRDLFPHANPQG